MSELRIPEMRCTQCRKMVQVTLFGDNGQGGCFKQCDACRLRSRICNTNNKKRLYTLTPGYEVKETYIEIFENQDDSKLKIISSVILVNSSESSEEQIISSSSSSSEVIMTSATT